MATEQAGNEDPNPGNINPLPDWLLLPLFVALAEALCPELSLPELNIFKSLPPEEKQGKTTLFWWLPAPDL